MPPKDLQEFPEIFAFHPDGEKIKIGNISDLSADFSDYEEEFSSVPLMQTDAFEVTWTPPTDVMHLLIYGRFPSNNWRKMHGQPLRRKGRRRRASEQSI